MDLRDYLKEKRLLMDGSMGTYYSMKKNSSDYIPEFANLYEPTLIKEIHKEYIEAGSFLIKTNTFAANPYSMEIDRGVQEDIIHAACRIAKEAVLECQNQTQEIFIAGNLGPIPELQTLDEWDILDEYKHMCDVFLSEGLDIFYFETCSDIRYVVPVAKYIKEKNPNAFLMVSFCVNKNGYTSSLMNITRLLEEIGEVTEIDACGLNCGVGPGHMYQLLKKITFPKNKFIIAAPNASYPEQVQNRMVFLDNVKYYKENMSRIAELGIDIVGGCCGTTPKYIGSIDRDILTSEKQKKEFDQITKQDTKKRSQQNAFFETFAKKKVIAVELDPPFDMKIDKVMECSAILKDLGADILTFADSPMGRSRIDSILMSIQVANECKIPVMPHICCRDKNMIAMRSGLLGAYMHNIRNLLIVTGDPVPVEQRTSATSVFDYNSVRLMEMVNEMNSEHFYEEPIYFGGALNYARGNLDYVIQHMQKKINAGATFFLTQPIFSSEDVKRIIDIKERVDTKILCGIMPLVSYRNANFIRNEITGIHVPEEIVARYDENMTKEEGEMVGAKIAIELMQQLEEYADGFYFMLPFNRVSLIEKIMKMRKEE